MGLISMARTSSFMLNESDSMGILVPDLRGNAFRFSLLSMMLDVSSPDMAFILLRYVSSIPT